MRLAVAVLAAFLSMGAGFPCGPWLTEKASGPGWVVIEVLPHPVGCTNPVRTITLDEQEIVPFYLGTKSFIVQASAGEHVVRVEDFCACPGSPCVACSEITVDVPDGR